MVWGYYLYSISKFPVLIVHCTVDAICSSYSVVVGGELPDQEVYNKLRELYPLRLLRLSSQWSTEPAAPRASRLACLNTWVLGKETRCA